MPRAMTPRRRWRGLSEFSSATCLTALTMVSTSGVERTWAVVAAVRPQPERDCSVVWSSIFQFFCRRMNTRMNAPRAYPRGSSRPQSKYCGIAVILARLRPTMDGRSPFSPACRPERVRPATGIPPTCALSTSVGPALTHGVKVGDNFTKNRACVTFAACFSIRDTLFCETSETS